MDLLWQPSTNITLLSEARRLENVIVAKTIASSKLNTRSKGLVQSQSLCSKKMRSECFSEKEFKPDNNILTNR
mgnify:CR=1 FL=1